MDMPPLPNSRPLTLFYSYVHADETLRAELEKHLSVLRRQGLISTWYDQQVMAGENRSEEILAHLNSTSLILLLISPDFLASDYCSGVEMQRALERHESGEAQVIPIMLRPVDWQGAPFEHLQGLPCDMKPVTSWSNRDEAFRDIARGIRWTIERLSNLSADSGKTFASSPEDDDPYAASLPALPTLDLDAREIQNRQRFLGYLRARYREVFEQSLQGTTLITPGLRSSAEAIRPPARLVFRHLPQREQAIPLGTPLLRLYEQTGGELLILGAPGAGKSTLLVHLAQNLRAKAERDFQQPCPVIFNLSSWNQKGQTLAHWLVEELFTSYQLPRKVGQKWVETGMILPLLDGLDEVHESMRSACIDAINAYRRDYLVPLLVCSRTREYLAQQRRLMLQSAVEIQPLDEEQINGYLAKAGPSGASVRTLLEQNPALRELAASPLLLNVLILAYREAPLQVQAGGISPEEQQRQIFASYIERMLAEEPHAQNTLERLTWLAQEMRKRNQVTFFQEQLQPDWLPGKRLGHVYDLLAVRLPGMLIGMLVSLIICTFLINPDPTQLILYLLLGAVPGGTLIRQALPQRKRSRGEAWRAFWKALPLRLVLSVLVGAGVGLAMGAFSFGLGAGLYVLLLQLFLRTPGLSAPRFARPSLWSHLERFLGQPALSNGLLAGLLAWLIFGTVEIIGYLTPHAAFSCHGCGGGSDFSVGGIVPMLSFFTFDMMANNIRSQSLTFQGMGGLGYGMGLGLTVFFLNWLLSKESRNILLTDRFAWSWRSLIRSLGNPRLIGVALASVVIVDAGLSLTLALQEALSDFFTSYVMGADSLSSVLSNLGMLTSSFHPQFFGTTLGAGLAYGLAFWFLLGLWQSVGSTTVPAHLRDTPNQGIKRSLINGIWLAVISAVVVASCACFFYFGLGIMLTVLLNAHNRDVVNAMSNSNGFQLAIDLFQVMLSTSLIVGLGVALLAGLLNGGLAYLRHYLLRFLLWRSGTLPWHLTAFLNEAERSILLRKAGAGYSFIHRLFLDYLASSGTSTSEAGSPAQAEAASDEISSTK